ncbi:MAG TPA: DUF1501 domain-containing protein [Pyrinomonadaceae bacterium]|jgi:uncharacterized protein (DUF1501 family)
MSQTRRDFLRQTGCLALGAGALAAGLKDFGLVNALAQSTTDYRALVCVFLNGGNDGNNTIVPTDDRYALYTSARAGAGLALPAAGQPGGLLQLTNASYGLHPALPELQALYNQGRVAVLCNTGPLVEPLTKASYQSGAGQKPAQLFSHSDQVAQWQSAVSDDASATGWGGRIADQAATLNGSATFPQLVSVAGINLFVTGQNTRPLGIADARTSLAQVLPLSLTGTTSEQTIRRAAFDNIRALAPRTLPRAAADVTDSALRTSAVLASADATLTIDFPNTTLGFQLEQIARLVKLRNTLGMKRQIFFCQLGGFDTHSAQQVTTNAGQGALLVQVSQAVKAFYDEMVAQGVSDKVTTFTLSDFGRTLQPAGTGAGVVGSDHAWGNHHFVVGGAVRGGFYGTYPTLQMGGPDDTDSGSNPRGRWIPTTSVEQYAATLALWYGLAQSDLTQVFPFITRFSAANLGFLL